MGQSHPPAHGMACTPLDSVAKYFEVTRSDVRETSAPSSAIAQFRVQLALPYIISEADFVVESDATYYHRISESLHVERVSSSHSVLSGTFTLHEIDVRAAHARVPDRLHLRVSYHVISGPDRGVRCVQARVPLYPVLSSAHTVSVTPVVSSDPHTLTLELRNRSPDRLSRGVVELESNRYYQAGKPALDVTLGPYETTHVTLVRTREPGGGYMDVPAESTFRVCFDNDGDGGKRQCRTEPVPEALLTSYDAMASGEMRAAVEALYAAMKKHRPAGHVPTILLLGPPGIGKSTFANHLLALASNRPAEHIKEATTCDSGILTCSNYLNELNVPLDPSDSSRVLRVLDTWGVGPNVKSPEMDLGAATAVADLLDGVISVGQRLDRPWRDKGMLDSTLEWLWPRVIQARRPDVVVFFANVVDLMGGADDWSATIMPPLVRQVEWSGGKVFAILARPNEYEPWTHLRGPWDVPAHERAQVESTARDVLGVATDDMGLFWPYTAPFGDETEHNGTCRSPRARSPAKDALTAGLLEKLLYRAEGVRRRDECLLSDMSTYSNCTPPPGAWLLLLLPALFVLLVRACRWPVPRDGVPGGGDVDDAEGMPGQKRVENHAAICGGGGGSGSADSPGHSITTDHPRLTTLIGSRGLYLIHAEAYDGVEKSEG